MLLKKELFFPGIFFCLCVIISCNQQSKNTADENLPKRIPVSVKDSALLSIDKSPMDMIYFPVDYPTKKMINPQLANPVARVIYSRPQKNGRIIFADSSASQNSIQRYGHEWRLGANEATEIEFFKPVSISGKKLLPGRYIIYCIPFADKWKIIFNENLYSWGLHIEKAKDLAEIDVPVIKTETEAEYFTMVFQNATNGCNLVMAWGDLKVVLPISFN